MASCHTSLSLIQFHVAITTFNQSHVIIYVLREFPGKKEEKSLIDKSSRLGIRGNFFANNAESLWGVIEEIYLQL